MLFQKSVWPFTPHTVPSIFYKTVYFTYLRTSTYTTVGLGFQKSGFGLWKCLNTGWTRQHFFIFCNFWWLFNIGEQRIHQETLKNKKKRKMSVFDFLYWFLVSLSKTQFEISRSITIPYYIVYLSCYCSCFCLKYITIPCVRHQRHIHSLLFSAPKMFLTVFTPEKKSIFNTIGVHER